MTFGADALANREAWTGWSADYGGERARRQWARDDLLWGIWGIPEFRLRIVGDVRGLDAVVLGCGTAYEAAWLARRGARPVGVDVTPAQLQTARELQREFGITFPLVEASAEDVPLPDSGFDLALSEYGAAIWCDPGRWLPEAARLLRPGGRLIFLCNSPLSILCSPDDGPVEDRLLRPQFGMRRFEWPEGGVNYHLGHGDMLGELRRAGFEVERLLELQAPDDATDHPQYEFVTADWARRWPSEEIWVARKRA